MLADMGIQRLFCHSLQGIRIPVEYLITMKSPHHECRRMKRNPEKLVLRVCLVCIYIDKISHVQSFRDYAEQGKKGGIVLLVLSTTTSIIE